MRAVVLWRGVVATLGSLLSTREEAGQHALVLQGRYLRRCLDCVPEAQGLIWRCIYLVGYICTQLYCSLSQAVLELSGTWRSGYNESS